MKIQAFIGTNCQCHLDQVKAGKEDSHGNTKFELSLISVVIAFFLVLLLCNFLPFLLKMVLSLKTFEGEKCTLDSRRHGTPRPTHRAFYIHFIAPKRLSPAVQRAVKKSNSSASSLHSLPQKKSGS